MKVPKPSDGKGGDFKDAYGDAITPSNPFMTCPEGTHNAVLVDFVDMGIVEKEYEGKKSRDHCCKLVFQVDETMPDGRPYIVSTTHFGAKISLHENAKLRGWIQGMRGRPLLVDDNVVGLPDKVGEPADLPEYIGMPCTVGVAHSLGGKDGDKVFANIISIRKHMTKLPKLFPTAYVRVRDRGKAPASEGFPNDAVDPTPADNEEIPF